MPITASYHDDYHLGTGIVTTDKLVLPPVEHLGKANAGYTGTDRPKFDGTENIEDGSHTYDVVIALPKADIPYTLVVKTSNLWTASNDTPSESYVSANPALTWRFRERKDNATTNKAATTKVYEHIQYISQSYQEFTRVALDSTHTDFHEAAKAEPSNEFVWQARARDAYLHLHAELHYYDDTTGVKISDDDAPDSPAHRNFEADITVLLQAGYRYSHLTVDE